MDNEFRAFRKNLGVVLADTVTAINEVAEACDKPKLRKKVFALKQSVERARKLCEAGEFAEERSLRGEPAPEFGNGARIIDL